MIEPHDLDAPDLRQRAVAAGRGLAAFDVLITGGIVIDTATAESRPADVGLVGPLIASVHAPGTREDAGVRLDGGGQFIVPGLIDTHLHIESSMATPRRYAETVVPQGTTTICWDPHEIGNVLGLDGVRWAVEASRHLPLRVLVFAPSCVPSAPGLERAGAAFGATELRAMLSWPEVAGVAEVMDMRGVLDRSPLMSGVVGAGLASGKLVCGHARSLSGPDLQAFAAAGVDSDHEIVSGDDVLEKLRAGFSVELRGSHDYVLPGVVAALRTLPTLPATLTVCTDDVFPDLLQDAGGMIDVLRRLVGHGMSAVDAIRAATLHAAIRIGRRDLGLIAPGRRADIVMLHSLDDMRVASVVANGRPVARDGALCAPLRGDGVPLPAASVHVPRLTPDDFKLPPGQDGRVRLRTVNKPRFTEWGEIEASVRDGAVVLPDGVILLAVIHRHGRAPPRPVLGVLENWSVWRGAIATTVAHDSHNLAVFGRDPADMATAANAVIEAQGGMAVASGGTLDALLELPICGLVSDAPMAEVAAALRALKRAADRIVEWRPPLLTFNTLVGATLACNAGPHVTDMGIADGTTGALFETALV